MVGKVSRIFCVLYFGHHFFVFFNDFSQQAPKWLPRRPKRPHRGAKRLKRPPRWHSRAPPRTLPGGLREASRKAFLMPPPSRKDWPPWPAPVFDTPPRTRAARHHRRRGKGHSTHAKWPDPASRGGVHKVVTTLPPTIGVRAHGFWRPPLR